MSAPIEIEDFYKRLGVSYTASGDEIRRAYLALAKKFHPDNFYATDAQAGAEAAFAKIQEAYQCLGSPASRKRYDLRRFGVMVVIQDSAKFPIKTFLATVLFYLWYFSNPAVFPSRLALITQDGHRYDVGPVRWTLLFAQVKFVEWLHTITPLLFWATVSGVFLTMYLIGRVIYTLVVRAIYPPTTKIVRGNFLSARPEAEWTPSPPQRTPEPRPAPVTLNSPRYFVRR